MGLQVQQCRDSPGRGAGQVQGTPQAGDDGRSRLRPADPLAAVSRAMLAQRGHLFPWVAVMAATGIGAYFALSVEPDGTQLAALAALALLLAGLARALGPAFGPLALAVALALAGFELAAWRTGAVAAPVLGFRYHGPVQGRIVDIDRSASDGLRLTLDQVVLADMAPERTPRRVRISLQREQPWLRPEPGMVVVTTAGLMPPNGPVEPGGFDFRLHAWFQGLGAVGYTQTPVLMLVPPEGGAALAVARLRARVSATIRALVPGDAGGLASAVITGDRSGLSMAASDAMRDANLYHLVSISGMHMGMLVGLVFAVLRGAVALVPPVALRVDGRKIAALAALPVAVFYLMLSGRGVATERAFVMAAVMLGAVLLDRRAFSMRSVALGALVVLALRPESLVNAGFQMSFAAVVGLIAAYAALGRRLPPGRWRWLQGALMLVFSSLAAGLATAPYAAAQFNRVAHYGLVANLLAVPVMGAVVMPAAILMLLLAPLGLEEPARLLVEWSCRWILAVSERVAALAGAVSAVPTPPGWVLPGMTFAALVFVLWQGRARWLGVAGVVAALAGWTMATRPPLLIAASGGIAGVMFDGGRGLSRPAGEGFVAQNWLRADGSLRPQGQAVAPFVVDGMRAAADLGGLHLLVLRGQRALDAVSGCDGADLMVVSVAVADRDARPCLVLDETALRRTGAVAGRVEGDALRLVAADAVAGARPWLPAGRGRDPAPAPFLLRPGARGWP
ncbi:MAG: ComEC/Rec2 family competence protein [Rubellimicrobium sp.]|nr:ComEC/Rec2 family competence protein [Rubellimicrobium sp.]